MRNLFPILLILCFFLDAGSLHAQSFDMKTAPVVKRGKLWRESRSELSMSLGDTLNTAYYHNMIVNLGYRYHLMDWLAVGANMGYSVPIKTRLSRNIESERSRPDAPFEIPATHLGLMGDIHLSLVPLAGKHLVLGRRALAYDFNLNFGAAVLQNVWNSNSAVKEDSQFLLAPMVGAGLRLFVKNNVAFLINVNDYIAKMETVADRFMNVQDASWRNVVVMTVGLAVFLPSEVRHEN